MRNHKYIKTASEAWAAFKLGRADSEAFIRSVTVSFGELNPKLPYEHCELKAQGLYEGVVALNSGEMEFKKMWEDYCANLQGKPS